MISQILSAITDNFFILTCVFVVFHWRYSDRVKAESERLDNIEFDDLEVTLSFVVCRLVAPEICFASSGSVIFHAFVQMDEEEKYNRKLESGLYTLQVWVC